MKDHPTADQRISGKRARCQRIRARHAQIRADYEKWLEGWPITPPLTYEKWLHPEMRGRFYRTQRDVA